MLAVTRLILLRFIKKTHKLIFFLSLPVTHFKFGWYSSSSDSYKNKCEFEKYVYTYTNTHIWFGLIISLGLNPRSWNPTLKDINILRLFIHLPNSIQKNFHSPLLKIPLLLNNKENMKEKDTYSNMKGRAKAFMKFQNK